MKSKIALAKLSPVVQRRFDEAPETMRALTAEFIVKKDLNLRAKIRAQMKAVLDFVSTDTSYPDLPQNSIGNQGYGLSPLGPPEYMANPTSQTPRGIQPIPGADNTL